MREHHNILSSIKAAAHANSLIIIAYQIHQPEKACAQEAFFDKATQFLRLVAQEVIPCERQFAEDDRIYEESSRRNVTIK